MVSFLDPKKWAHPFQFLLCCPKNLHLYHQQHKAARLCSGLIGSGPTRLNYSGSLKGEPSTCRLNSHIDTHTHSCERVYRSQHCSGASPLLSEQISSFNERPPCCSTAVCGTVILSLTFKSERANQMNFSATC